MSDIIKLYAATAVVFTLLAIGWFKIYVAPHDEFRTIVMACQIDINDMSYEGYEYCVAVNRPTE